MKFHVHGPFSSTVARDSIPYNKDNKQLYQHIFTLLSESLHEIEKLGLLTIDFLAVLPNDADELAEFYKPLQAAVIKEMKVNPLVPTHNKEFAPAQKLYHGPAAIRDVISDDDLQFFAGNKSVLWAAGAMQNSRQEKFMKTLGIQEWGWEDLIGSIEEKFDYADDNNKKWLVKKPEDWMQRFYILLKKAIAETDRAVSRSCEIVRVQSGDHISGNEAFFPDEENKKSKNSDSFPRVKSELLRGQRKQGVREFLESIGVKEVGKEEELKYILDTYYSDADDNKEVSDKQHITHMKKFVSFWKSQEEEAKELLSDYAIFSDQSGKVSSFCKRVIYGYAIS